MGGLFGGGGHKTVFTPPPAPLVPTLLTRVESEHEEDRQEEMDKKIKKMNLEFFRRRSGAEDFIPQPILR
jgi:hypothetical protein